ncbi:redoxin domain-containing protein [Phaeovulum sp.]|uniref:redoxin domain-containing protein n=1 Tax=Phaeovulum sp. TaxID=2934796 RepID=UPI00356B35DA
MDLSIFGQHMRPTTAQIDVPRTYDSHMRWVPKLGDVFPNFQVAHGDGVFDLYDWADGNWVYFFSHPALFTPVCTTEIADVAAHADELASRGAKALNISRDHAADQTRWLQDIERLFGLNIDFPLLSDPDGTIASACGMMHPSEESTLCVRKSFILDPSLRIRMISEYPMNVGRDFEEFLRVIDALQATESNSLVAPGGWMPGDALLVHPYSLTEEAQARFGERLQVINGYLRLVHPKTKAA